VSVGFFVFFLVFCFLLRRIAFFVVVLQSVAGKKARTAQKKQEEKEVNNKGPRGQESVGERQGLKGETEGCRTFVHSFPWIPGKTVFDGLDRGVG